MAVGAEMSRTEIDRRAAVGNESASLFFADAFMPKTARDVPGGRIFPIGVWAEGHSCAGGRRVLPCKIKSFMNRNREAESRRENGQTGL